MQPFDDLMDRITGVLDEAEADPFPWTDAMCWTRDVQADPPRTVAVGTYLLPDLAVDPTTGRPVLDLMGWFI